MRAISALLVAQKAETGRQWQPEQGWAHARVDPWMRTTDVAPELGVAADTVRRFIRTRRLRASVIVVNGRPTFRIRRRDFEGFRRSYVKDSISDDWE